MFNKNKLMANTTGKKATGSRLFTTAKAVPTSVQQAMGVSQSQATLPTRIPMSSTGRQKKVRPQISLASPSTRPSTAATSKMLSSIQNQSMGHSQSAHRMPSGISRTMRMEAKIAEENAKKQTVARAPVFASDARASRRNMDLLMFPERKVKLLRPGEHLTPTLFTLQRARKRTTQGETHRLFMAWQDFRIARYEVC